MSSPVAVSPVTSTHVVRVPVTTVWSSPESPRPVDAPVVADDPDVAGWLAALDARTADDESGDGRLGLHGRVETQLLEGEPVCVTDTSGSWSRTAEALHLHVNTVRYRIGRVEELTGRDLSSLEDRVDVFLALRSL